MTGLWIGLECALLGFLIGYILRSLRKNAPVGTLRLRRDEPGEAPYLFLEIDEGKMREIYESSQVVLRVDFGASRK